jgi:hypothetical protein
MKLTGENQVLGGKKTCPSAILSTIKPILTDPGSNPGLRGERPATNRLSHGTAQCIVQCLYIIIVVFCSCVLKLHFNDM